MDNTLKSSVADQAIMFLNIPDSNKQRMELFVEMAHSEVMKYCNISIFPDALRFTLVEMAAHKYNSSMGAGLSSSSYSGVSESYSQTYPQHIMNVLNAYRVVRFV